jgi:PhnB protein
MKNYTQVYVRNSIEAAALYCRAFGAEVTFEIKNSSEDAYEHCELSVNGEVFLALSEAKNPCDTNLIHKMKWQTMTFNVFEMGSEEAVQKAFDVLSDGGVVIDPIMELPWSRYCATVIDKYGVCWWISI